MIEYIEEKDYGAEETVSLMVDAVLTWFSLPNMTVEVQVAGDDTIRDLNREFRQIDQTTDVLSFPNFEADIENSLLPQYLGSIAISMPKAETQAQEYGHSLKREIAFLTTHGMLHLLGYDHQNEEEEKEMTSLARSILDSCDMKRTGE